MFKRLICGVPTATDLSLSRRRSGSVQALLVAGGLALLIPALLPLMPDETEDSVESLAVHKVSAVNVESAKPTNRDSQSRAVLEIDSDDFSPIDDAEAVELLRDRFLALAEDDATLTDLADDASELTGPWGCPRMSHETRVAAAPQVARSPSVALPLPLPDELSGSAPQLPELLPEAIVETASSSDFTPTAVADSTRSDLPAFDDELAPVSKPKVHAGAIQLIAVLAVEDVKQLVVRARLELAAGDVLLAHRFAEAAAEVPIPLELFQQRPLAVLDEIDFTNQVRRDLQVTESAEKALVRPTAEPATLSDPVFEADDPSVAQAPTEKPTESNVPVAKPKGPRPTERIKKTPRAFQAIAQASLNVQPRLMEAAGQPQRLPESQARKQLAELPKLEHTTGTGRNWGTTVYSWDAPSFYHSPTYFEDIQLERYGNEIAFVQPVVSGLHFLKDAATVPYQMGIEGNCPTAEIYDLGHDRPGDCVQYSWQRLPFSTTGTLTQAGAVLGLIFIIP